MGSRTRDGHRYNGRSGRGPVPLRELIIVESPTKAKTIGQYLGKQYTVLSSQGHVRD
ncbi:MAG TPA: hypothetical protein ENN96_00800, partial [Candidatus Acetothermia bacterium]|nr:hypothetical protein [Candidatus Acetothermia bacterium]